jgi:endonuclease/exonuclease/phosphatase (EEP) superfamily protein YafD
MSRKVAVKWLARLVMALAVLYPLSLILVAATLRYVGEGWWMAAVALYLPRVGFAAPLPIIVLACLALRMRRLVWLQVLSALLLILPLMGLALPWPSGADPGKPKMRVLSFNVNSAHGGVQPVLGEIGRYSPDIVALQESGDDDPLSGPLRALYPTVLVSGQFILATRYAVTETTEPDKLVYDGHARSARWNRHVLDTPLGHVVLYNVHPISPREALYGLRGQGGLVHEIRSGHLFSGTAAARVEDNVGLRTLQLQSFSDSARRETDPVIIAGDTNLPALSALFHRYLSPFDDGFSIAGRGFGYTFPTDRWRPWMRIDRILASRPLRFVEFQVGRSLASDHHCVVADLQRRE